MKKKYYKILLLLGLVIIAIWVTVNYSENTLQIEQTAYAVSDTSSITKIVLSDDRDSTISLRRITPNSWYGWILNTSIGWMLNDKYLARQDAINLVLEAIRNIKVKDPVSKSAFQNVVTQIAAKHIKVEIYQGKDNLLKIWYIGSPTIDHYGTFMLLETPEHGKSSVPHVMYIPGFNGFLTPRFFMGFNDWRWTGIFHYHPLQLATISYSDYAHPNQSFKINYYGNNNLKLLNGNGDKIAGFDTNYVKNYMLEFKNINMEQYDHLLSKLERDSMLSISPHYKISVIDTSGLENSILIYDKKALLGTTNAEGDTLLIDPERMNGYYKGEWVILQNFSFDHLFVPLNTFLKKPLSSAIYKDDTLVGKNLK